MAMFMNSVCANPVPKTIGGRASKGYRLNILNSGLSASLILK